MPFQGHRNDFRRTVETEIQNAIHDPDGRLQISEAGVPTWSGAKVFLSYSHTQNLGLLVFSKTNRIGVDIESLDRLWTQDLKKIAERFFSPEEAMRIKAVTGADLKIAFLDLWTRKEAYAKFSKLGLSRTIQVPVDQISDVAFQAVPVVPTQFVGAVCLDPLHRT